MRSSGCLVWLLALLLFATPERAWAQGGVPDTSSSTLPVRFSTGAIPDTVTVGDRFQSLVRVAAPPGSRIAFPPSPEATDALQSTDSVRVFAGSDGAQTAVYPLVAWRVAQVPAPRVSVPVVLPDGRQSTFQVSLRLPAIRSVLPVDTAGIEPRGPKDVAGGWNLWLITLLVLGAASVLVLTWLFWRRTRRAAAPLPASPADPRQEALAALMRAEALRTGEPKPFFAAVSDALRHYLAALSPAWGTDLTTEELIVRLRADDLSVVDLEQLHRMLRRADLVKFARARPPRDEMEHALVAARDWIGRFSPPVPGEEMQREVA